MRKKIVVFATSFLDKLVTHPVGSGEPARLLQEAARRHALEVEFRCDRDPADALRPQEIEGAVAVIADLEQWDAQTLANVGRAAGGDLGLLARYGIGYNNVDLGAAREAGVLVTNTPGASARPTAEWTVATLLDVAGRRVAHHNRAAAGQTKSGPSRIDVSGKTLGVIGTGTIGKHVVAMMRGFDLTVIASDPCPDYDWASAHDVEYLDISALCRRADFITLHAAAQTQLLTATQIEQMKPTAVLVNCARGMLVDNPAVYAAVCSGALYGYGLDEVWEHADLPLEPGINIAVSPHVGSDSDSGKLRMQQMSVAAVTAFLAGARPQHIVNGG